MSRFCCFISKSQLSSVMRHKCLGVGLHKSMCQLSYYIRVALMSPLMLPIQQTISISSNHLLKSETNVTKKICTVCLGVLPHPKGKLSTSNDAFEAYLDYKIGL